MQLHGTAGRRQRRERAGRNVHPQTDPADVYDGKVRPDALQRPADKVNHERSPQRRAGAAWR